MRAKTKAGSFKLLSTPLAEFSCTPSSTDTGTDSAHLHPCCLCHILLTSERLRNAHILVLWLIHHVLPGIIQLARSPFLETCIAPKIVKSMWPPRIIANESSLEKKDPPGRMVTVCFPALIRSGSSSPAFGNGPLVRLILNRFAPLEGSRCTTVNIPYILASKRLRTSEMEVLGRRAEGGLDSRKSTGAQSYRHRDARSHMHARVRTPTETHDSVL